MSRPWKSSVILVVVFALGLAAGIVGMVYAWPGIHRHFSHRNETFSRYLQRTIPLDAAQMPRIEAVLKDNFERQHQIHLEFVPKYAQVCNEFSQISDQEHDTYLPVRQQTLDQLKAIMSPTQWDKFQKQRAANRSSNRRPDLCRHVLPRESAPKPSGPPPSGSRPPRF